ncbi:MAG: hypothetical protein AUJ00_00045 [Gemmatimonadetes bacterium 13_1_40CM_3_70_6]|nr:MAG: hypothetical protein AUJ00_00045 [Gemmatimonadetes bacterium 13_1_40CM_3_70_6]
MLGDALDLQPPVLRIGALVAQALERDADLDLEAPRRHVAARLIHEIGVQVDGRVEAAAGAGAARRAGVHAVAPHAVLLDAERVHGEEQGTAVVVVGVEQDVDAVVAVDVVAVGERRAHHGAVRLEGAHAEVDRVGRVPDEHLRRVGGGARVHRPVFGEAGEHRGLLPHRLVEAAVDRDRGVDAREADVEPARAAVVDGARIAGRLQQQEQGGEHVTKI